MDMWTDFGAYIGQYLVNVLAAVGILVVGWILAWLLSGVVRKTLRRTGIHERLTAGVAGEESVQEANVDRWVGRSVFIVLMIFVVIAVFEALLLQSITAPLSEMLAVILDYAPRLAGAILLLGLAWVVAVLLRKALEGGLSAVNLDERLDRAGMEAGEVSLSTTIAQTVYWLVFLLFLPAILSTLQLGGLLGPVERMIDEILSYLPNVAIAALILAVGWVAARLVQRIVTQLLSSVGLDRLADRYHAGDMLGRDFSAAKTTGVVVHVLIFLPVIVAALNALQIEAITAPAEGMLELILAAIPALFAAALLLVVAWFVGYLVSGVIERGLNAVGFDQLFLRLGLIDEKTPRVAGRTPSQVAAWLVLVAILLIATMEALSLLQFGHVADLIAQVLVFFGQVLIGLVAIGLGLYLANIAASTIRTSDTPQADTLAQIAQVAIVVLALAIGLQQMGLADEIISLAFGLMLGAVAVAAAIAFGLGGRDAAARQIERWTGNGGSGGGRGGSRSRAKRASSRSGGTGSSSSS
ncbi:MAG: mechanosensitive ion channel [Trueperaceae bacterium]|nr:mechanosensitive ion channel [Trueperaceae bacterium]